MNIIALVISIFLAQLAGLIGSIFTLDSISSWYFFLNKPFFSPPNWLFGPVWVTLYTLMGIAAWLIWKERKNSNSKFALGIYAVQLILNVLWTVIFFGFKSPSVAFFEIVVLLSFIVFNTALFFKINKWAGWLMVPYIFWVSFASLLNLAIWVLN